MKTCRICGNDIHKHLNRCPFCNTHQGSMKTRAVQTEDRVRTVMLKSGLPTVEEGCLRLETALFEARKDGVQVLRIIHGWGSGGSEGKLRDACRAYLNRKIKVGLVKTIIMGEEYSRGDSEVKKLLSRYTSLQASERTDSKNPGITFAIL